MQARNPSNIKIIDVSHHQETINWLKVAGSDIKGAYIKATEGLGYVDPMFRRNAVGAPAAGLKIGFYHYARPESGNSTAAEAQSFLDAVKGLPSDFPHVLDIEGTAAKLGKDKLTAWCLEWLRTVEKVHNVMIYTGDSFEHDYLGTALGQYPLWVAHYGGVIKPVDSPIWGNWTMFQYDDKTSVPGIVGNTVDISEMDLNFWNKLISQSAPALPIMDDLAKVVVTDEKGNKLMDEGIAPISKGTSYIPIRAVSQALGCKVFWNEGTKTITIQKP